jgi:hypothetical protein
MSNGAVCDAVLVSRNALAAHLGMTRHNVARLAAEAIIERRADGRSMPSRLSDW